MFDAGDIVKMERGARFPKNIINRMNFSNDNTYKVLEVLLDKHEVLVESIMTGNTYEICTKNLILVKEFSPVDTNKIAEKSINSTLEELYEMILKENCSEDLKNKFWDLHKVLSSKEREAKIRLEEINRLLWE